MRVNPRYPVRTADLSFALTLLALPVTDYFVIYFLSQLYLRKVHKIVRLARALLADHKEIYEPCRRAYCVCLARHGVRDINQVPHEEAEHVIKAAQVLRVMNKAVRRYHTKFRHALGEHARYMTILSNKIREHNESSEEKIPWKVASYREKGTTYLRR